MLRTILVALGVVLGVASARAEVDSPGPLARGFDAVPNKPVSTLDGFLTLDGARPAAAGAWRAGLLLDFVAPTLAVQVGTEPLGALIPWRLDAHFVGAYSFHKHFELALALPVTLRQGNRLDRLTELGFAQDPVAQTGLSDIRLVPRATLLDPAEFPLGLALSVELRAPVGAHLSFIGDRGPVLTPRLAAERSFGPVRLGANAGYRVRPLPGRYFNLFVGNEITFGLGGALRIPGTDTGRKVDVLAELTGATASGAPFTFGQAEVLKTPLELLVGVRGKLYKNLGGELAAGTGLTGQRGSGYGRELVRIIGGLTWTFDPAEAGVVDDPDRDSDGDGIPDREDRCPNDPGPREYQGCPDTDGDEVPDIEDKCPDLPGIPELDGCPLDQPPYVEVEASRLRLRANVRFDTGQATIRKESFPILDEVAEKLGALPQIEKVQVEGHTDNVGSRNYNVDLSQRRSRAVLEYLVKRGVGAKRLTAKGFGFDKPIAPNATPLGRAKNRRVEFTILKGPGL